MTSRAKTSVVVLKAVEAVRHKISSGEYRQGSALPSEIDLAAQFGTSRGTVRKAIELLVHAGDLSRVRHSRPIIASKAGGAHIGRGEEIPVWVSRPLADGAILSFLRGVSKGLQGTSYRMVVRDPRKFTGQIVKSDERHFLMDRLADTDLPGAIIWRNAFGHNEDLMRRLGDTGKPIVYVDVPPPHGVRGDFVGSANATAARAIVEYLLDMGHTRIAFVADTVIPETIRDRLRGYERAMKAGGVEDQSLVIVANEEPPLSNHQVSVAGPYARYAQSGSYFCDLALRAIRKILSQDPAPTAIFACHDVLATTIHALLSGMGIRIPEEISLVGFDWIADTERGFPDELTTAVQSFEGFGIHAANLILDRASGEVTGENRHVLLDAPLIERSSTAPRLALPVFEPARPLEGAVALSRTS